MSLEHQLNCSRTLELPYFNINFVHTHNLLYQKLQVRELAHTLGITVCSIYKGHGNIFFSPMFQVRLSRFISVIVKTSLLVIMRMFQASTGWSQNELVNEFDRFIGHYP